MTESRTDAVEASLGHRSVTHAAVSAFGGMTGDRARLHYDHHFGRANGGPIAHGLLNACWAVGALSLHAPARMGLGDHDAIFGEFSLRLMEVVKVGDTLCLQWSEAADEAQPPSTERHEEATEFTMLNQSGIATSSGRVTIWRGDDCEAKAPEAWSVDPHPAPSEEGPLYADDMLAAGL